MREIPRTLWIGLGILTALLVATSVPGVLIIDESNYLVTVLGLRAGRLTVPETEGLMPSAELAWFDPTMRVRSVTKTPVGSTAPPLYAFLALPFSAFGWRGLVALNALSFAASGLLVFWLARRWATRPKTPWVALVTYLVGGYTLEYAQGVWPHALSAALCMAGFCCACRAADEGSARLAALGGFVLGLAVGVRYQNAVFAAIVGLCLALVGVRRWRAGAAYAAACAVPLVACSFINHVRLDSWNPVSKGRGYLTVGGDGGPSSALLDAPRVFYAKVVDFSTHPVPVDPATDIQGWWRRNPRTGAAVFNGAVKKAWLQSSPWIVVALGGLALAWRGRPSDASTGEIWAARTGFLVIAAVLATFALAGFARHDGPTSNQRYFLELVPLCAVAAAWVLDRRELSTGNLRLGLEIGVAAGLVLILCTDPSEALRQRLEMKLPLVLAVGLSLSMARAAERRLPAAPALLFGACVGWAAAIHLMEDRVIDRGSRLHALSMTREAEAWLPEGPLAVIAAKPWPETLTPLTLRRDLLLADPLGDKCATTVPLVAQLLERGRRVLFFSSRIPRAVQAELSARYKMRVMREALPTVVFSVERAAR